MARPITGDIAQDGPEPGAIKYPPIGYHVRIRAPEISGRGAQIWLDDIELRGVKKYSVEVGIDMATEVTIVLIADSVNREKAGWPE